MLSYDVLSGLNQQDMYREIHEAKQQTRNIIRVQLVAHEREKRQQVVEERSKELRVGRRLDVRI